MTAKSTLLGTLPDPMKNGLSGVADQFEEDPTETLTVVATLAVKKVEYDVETGDAAVKFHVTAIEAVGGSDESFVLSTMRAVQEKRTGVPALDGFEDAMKDAADAETGEIPEGEA